MVFGILAALVASARSHHDDATELSADPGATEAAATNQPVAVAPGEGVAGQNRTICVLLLPSVIVSDRKGAFGPHDGGIFAMTASVANSLESMGVGATSAAIAVQAALVDPFVPNARMKACVADAGKLFSQPTGASHSDRTTDIRLQNETANAKVCDAALAVKGSAGAARRTALAAEAFTAALSDTVKAPLSQAAGVGGGGALVVGWPAATRVDLGKQTDRANVVATNVAATAVHCIVGVQSVRGVEQAKRGKSGRHAPCCWVGREEIRERER